MPTSENAVRAEFAEVITSECPRPPVSAVAFKDSLDDPLACLINGSASFDSFNGFQPGPPHKRPTASRRRRVFRGSSVSFRNIGRRNHDSIGPKLRRCWVSSVDYDG